MNKRTILFVAIWALGIFLTFDNNLLESIGLSGHRKFYALLALVAILFALVVYDIPRVLRIAKRHYSKKRD